MKQPIALAALAFASFALSGCSGGSEEAREQQMEDMARSQGINADVELDEDGNAQVSLNGGTIGTNLGVPDDFPDDVFVDSAWNVTGVTAMPGGVQMLQAMTGADAASIIESVRGQMIADGWSAAQGPSDAGPTMGIQFEKGGRMTGYNVITTGENQIIAIRSGERPG